MRPFTAITVAAVVDAALIDGHRDAEAALAATLAAVVDAALIDGHVFFFFGPLHKSSPQ